MPVKLAITGLPVIEIDAENITLGSDPVCTVFFDNSNVMPKHALIRRIAGRWLIEVREAPAIFVGGPTGHAESKRLHWLSPGDQIRLCETGPAITFEPSNPDSVPLVNSESVSRSIDDVINEIILQRENDAPLTDVTTEPPSSHVIRTINSGRQISSTVTSPAVGETGSQPSDALRPNQSSDDQRTAIVPVLTRVAWSDGDSLTGDEFSNDDKLTPEQAEIRWVMSVVMRCFGAGAIVLVVWLIISAVMKP